jgi:hypothetical protein
MAGLIDELRESHGSVAGYLRSSGLDDIELRNLRRVLVSVDGADTH